MRSLSLCLAAVLTACLTGCNIFPARVDAPVRYYEISPPSARAKLNIRLALSSVDCVFSERSSMVFRDGANSVRVDDFNKWCLLPSSMLRSYFILFLNDSNDDSAKSGSSLPEYLLRMRIVRFDFDLVRRTANVAAEFGVYDAKSSRLVWRRLITAEKKSQTENATAFASAMSSAVAEMASRLAAGLNASELRVGTAD